jgi:hypothetical protein
MEMFYLRACLTSSPIQQYAVCLSAWSFFWKRGEVESASGASAALFIKKKSEWIFLDRLIMVLVIFYGPDSVAVLLINNGCGEEWGEKRCNKITSLKPKSLKSREATNGFKQKTKKKKLSDDKMIRPPFFFSSSLLSLDGWHWDASSASY